MKKILLTSAVLATVAGGVSLAQLNNTTPAKPPAAPATNAPAAAAPARAGAPRVQAALNSLPADKAAAARQTLEKDRAATQAKAAQLRTIRTEMRTLMGAQTFDKKAYMAKAKQAADLQSEIQLKQSEAMADLAAQLPADQRQTLSEGRQGQGRGDRANQRRRNARGAGAANGGLGF